MIEFGKTLKAAREAKGYTIQQIADATHMMSTLIDDLEKENFTKIPAPIYGRGFVKLYCQAVGLEAKPLVDEFMAIYTGSHQPVLRERAVAAEPPPAPAGNPVDAPEPPIREAHEFRLESDSLPPSAPPEAPLPKLPPNLWRMVALGAVAVAILLGAVLGIRALYRATSDVAPAAEEKPCAAKAAPEREPPAATAPRAPRKLRTVKPLYFD